jgi:hypothetical protein
MRIVLKTCFIFFTKQNFQEYFTKKKRAYYIGEMIEVYIF